ncbi:MAG: bifunctional diaminohydroxyphosphoribosylaminopyrimidine deaminase/5-amino-6-(5-phosphoribosylamino)uracil reductase RibD [Vicinamibacterales bacterium]
MLTPSDYMDRALFLAARGRGRTTPNPMVGAVVVAPDGVVVGWGYHAKAGEAHAEVKALRMAGERARGATLYCTLEPCSHWGRTPPCAPLVADSGIRHLVAAMQDPNPRVSGQGFALLRERGVTVDTGLQGAAAESLNRGYITRTRHQRPFVILKAAIGLDGAIAEAPGRRTALTSHQANRHAHQVRAEVDAIGVGSQTILVDDPLLTARGPYRPRPLLRVIFDRTLRMAPGARVLSTLPAGPVIIVTGDEHAGTEHARRLTDLGARIEYVEAPTVAAALARLATIGVGSLLLEGGARLQGAAWDEQLVDAVQLYVAPRVFGPGAVRFLEGRPFRTGDLVERRTLALGPDVLIEGYVHRTH